MSWKQCHIMRSFLKFFWKVAHENLLGMACKYHAWEFIVDSLEKFGFWELDAREVFPLSIKWRLAKDWERPTKRAITAIIMHSDKTLLTKA
jgi:hypothetical protein